MRGYDRPVQRLSAASDPPGVEGLDRAQPSRWPHAIAIVVLSAMFIAGGKTLSTTVLVVLFLLVSACVVDLMRREGREPGSPLPIACATAILLTIAVIIPSRFSGDLWSYAIAGRMIRYHHSSPYLPAAIAFPHDPFLALVGREWRHGTTPYGPLFTLFSAGVSFVGGTHPLLYRLAFQGSTALAIGVALLVVWRTTRSTSALVLLGLHPVVACSVVNGGHNDAFIGLGILLAVISARREHYVASGWCVAAALLVKVTAGLALLPLLAWVWVRAGHRRAVVQVAAAPLLVAVPVMLLTPGMASSLHSAKTSVITRASIWNIPYRWLLSVHGQEPHTTAMRLVSYALLLVLVLAAYAAWRTRRRDDPVPGVIAALAVWLVFSAYVLPWYTVWALPIAALLPWSRLSWFVVLQGLVITALAIIPRDSLTGGTAIGHVVHFVAPVVVVGLFLWAVAPALRRTEPGVVATRTL